jgi:hypothetical protein
MIWFGKSFREALSLPPAPLPAGDENVRMEHALIRVAQRAPHLGGDALVDALAHTGFVDRDTAARLLPTFRHFDPDRCFAEALRSLAFRGPAQAGEFRARIQRVVADLTGDARLGEVGPEEAVRFAHDGREGIVLAYPQVGFTVGGAAMQAVEAAVDEMPDALVIVAKNFQEGTAPQLQSLLARTEVPGTLVTVNLLLGMRAVTLRYQPSPHRVVDLLGAGRPLRSRDIALLGNKA